MGKSKKGKEGVGGNQGLATAIDIVGQVGASVITTVYAIKNQNLQNSLAEGIQQLDQNQKDDLENKISQATDTNKRIEVLINYVTNAIIQKRTNKAKGTLTEDITSKVRKERLLIFGIFGVSILAILTFLIIKKRSKNAKR